MTGDRRPRSLRWWSLNVVVPGVGLAALVFLIWGRRDELQPLIDDPGIELILIGALLVVAHFLNSTEFWLLYRAQGATIPVLENWMVFTAGNLGNLLPGQAGTFYKFRYMRDVRGMPYALSATNYGANLVLTLGSSACVGLVGIVATALGPGALAVGMLAVFAALGAACVTMLLWPAPNIRWLRGKPAREWASVQAGWDELRRQPRVTVMVILLDIGKYLLTAWRFQLAFSLLGVDQSFFFFLVIGPAAALAGIIAVTPAALGFREAFITAAAVGMGTDFDTGLLASTVDRGVLLAATLTVGSIGYLTTWSRLTRVAEAPPR